jgi:cell division protein DivIC
VGVAVIIVFAVMVSLSVKSIFDLKAEEAALQERNSELIHLKEDLLMTLDNVNSDEFIEEQARKELKLAKGNELIFYFPDDWEAKHE